MKVYVNGNLEEMDRASISVRDHGFLYGAGLFETIRAYKGHLFLFDAHFSRMVKGARFFQIAFHWTKDELRRAVLETMKANHLSDAYIRITLSAGVEGVGLHAGVHNNPTLVIHAMSLPVFPRDLYRRGKKLLPVQSVRVNRHGLGRFKTLNFLPNLLARKELAAAGADSDCEGILLDEHGNVAEGIVSNLFFFRGDTLYTPALSMGILPGITRDVVLDLAKKIGYRTEEGEYSLSVWEQADEVFLTSSIQEIVPVYQVDQSLIGHGEAGSRTKILMESYRKVVAEQADV